MFSMIRKKYMDQLRTVYMKLFNALLDYWTV